MRKLFGLALFLGLLPAAAMAQANPPSSSANVAFNNVIPNIPANPSLKNLARIIRSAPMPARPSRPNCWRCSWWTPAKCR
jgi:hypothetical protein